MTPSFGSGPHQFFLSLISLVHMEHLSTITVYQGG